MTDSVAPCRLTFGSLSVAGAVESEKGLTSNALFFEVQQDGTLGRVTFEGLDSVRASRGEVAPYEDGDDFSSWVYQVSDSGWLAERHRYEWTNYETSLIGHSHYLFRFHDEFVEAIAKGIWLDVTTSHDPFRIEAPHPMADDLPSEHFLSGTTAGLSWTITRIVKPETQLLQDARLCSQRIFDFALELDGKSQVLSSCWLRVRDGTPRSFLTRAWVGVYAEVDGIASVSDLLGPWDSYCSEVAGRRKDMGK